MAPEVLVMIDNVAGPKHVEYTLMAAKSHLAHANLDKSCLLAAAGKNLRQSRQTLSLVREILAKRIKDKEALNLIARLNQTTDAMLGMLDTLLNVNQLEAGLIHPEKIDFPINDLLEPLRIEFAYHAQARGLLWHVVPCRLSILSDPRLLEQMIRNLLSNAVKCTERGKILLGCRRRGDKLRIEVWDTGAGIPEGQLHMILEEFHQFDNLAGERNRGLGLDLSIVQRLGNLLGHSIDVYSRPGKGSVFAVEAPLGEQQPGAPLQRYQSGTGHNVGIQAAILVVEDDPSVREMLALLFTGQGHRTVAAADGKEALALAQGTVWPDIVVAKYSLPNDMTGLQVVANVREALGSEIPAVILTDDISTDTMREITQQGCVRCYNLVAEKLTHLIEPLLTDTQHPTVRASSLPQAELKGDMLRPTIFVVDDEGAVREGISGLLRKEGWTVESHASGEAFLKAYRPGGEGCLVVDARMPHMGGLELLERLKIQGGGPPAIMITGHADIQLAVQAMKAGAMGFLEKPVQYGELVINIERALELSSNSAALSSLREEAARRIAGLTSRERQVVDMVVAGNPNKQIAYVLGISQRTVETHRGNAMKKIGVRSLSELIHLTIAGSPRDT